MSSGRAVSACYVKEGAVSSIIAQNPQTNISYQGKTIKIKIVLRNTINSD